VTARHPPVTHAINPGLAPRTALDNPPTFIERRI
jgi:hypothetical protein